MMEIPAGLDCMACPYLHWSNVIDEYECSNTENGISREYPDHGLRSAACLSAYPNGATITITAKPSVEIGFIPKEQTVDSKTGGTTFTDIELLEVSEIKPK